MKQLVCEMCNSNDLLKDGDYFICQHCGCKYTVEAAKKMMIEGTVDVTGSTVKVDETNKLNNIITLAKRAAEKTHEFDKAADYYKQAVEMDPNNSDLIWNSYYYTYLSEHNDNRFSHLGAHLSDIFDIYKSESTNNDELLSKVLAIKNIINECLDVYPTNIGAIYLWAYFGNAAHKHFAELNDERFSNLISDALKTFVNANFKYSQNSETDERFQEGIKHEVSIIRQYDKTYEPPHLKNKNGCYVATAVYGSYDCPEVWTLRRYRDYDLAKTWYGRLFIKTYYAISPTIVKWFGDTEWFKNMWRGKLDRMVTNLKSRGYEDTPYEDKDWK